MNKPFPDTDYARFYSFASVLRDFTDSVAGINLTADIFFDNSDVRRFIEEKVGHLGFRRISDIARKGSFALVFEGNNHQMLRIVTAEADERRFNDWSILQPLASVKCGSGNNALTIEVLPKVHTLYEIINDKELSQQYKLTEDDFPSMARELLIYHLHKGRLFFDPGLKNIGIIRDPEGKNVPVVIDPGAVVDRNRIDDPIWLEAGNSFRDEFTRRCERIPDFEAFEEQYRGNRQIVDAYLDHLSGQSVPEYRFQEAQEYHLKCLGLEPGKANRVISGEDLEKFYAERESMAGGINDKTGEAYNPKNSVYARMAKDDGLYPEEIGKNTKKAAAKFPKPAAGSPPREKGFCHEIEAEKRKYQESLR